MDFQVPLFGQIWKLNFHNLAKLNTVTAQWAALTQPSRFGGRASRKQKAPASTSPASSVKPD